MAPGDDKDHSARSAAELQWSRNPAGTTYVQAEPGSRRFYEEMTAVRYRLQPWHPDLLRRFAPTGRLLEIGCGAGTDHAELAKMAESTVAIDLAFTGADLTSRRLALEGRASSALVADGEALPFRASTFDSVYSFGVIHHTDHPDMVVTEIGRVLKPGGRFLVGLYHRNSLFTLFKLISFIRSRRFLHESWRDFLATIEAGAAELKKRPLVRLYTRHGAEALFSGFKDVRTEVVHAGVPYGWGQKPWMVRRFGWYVIVTGTRLSS